MSPKKSLSQNFLIDKNICNKIISQVTIKNKIIIEIGPGKGALTDIILSQKPKKLYLIEKDNALSKELKKKYENQDKISIYNQDIFDFSLSKFKNIIIISNLPYNISTKIILYLFNYNNIINEMILMLQKEVVIPKPKVNSSVVKFKLIKGENDSIKLKKFSKIIFNNKRKKITNKINFNINNDNLLNKRVDQLTINELLNIYNFF